MARRAKEPDLEADRKEHQIIEELDKKRRQLDQDVAEFKAEREHEYRVFEKQLRDKSKEHSVQDTSQIQRKRGRSKQKNTTAGAVHLQKEEVGGIQRKRDIGNADQKGPETEDLIDAGRSKSSPGGSPGPPDRPTEVLHEREKEFQALFTPSYLPPVGNSRANEGNNLNGFLQPPSFSSEDLSVARHNSSAMLSSSAENVHPPMTSPPLPPARPLSSSVPPEESSHHRRDSSRSDTSIASLRSSLRDPKQPRSPKRVLFSIDDTLVSPSTSPIAQRSKPTTFMKPVDSVGAIGGFEKFDVVRDQSGDDRAASRFQTNGLGISSSNAPENRWTTSFSQLHRATESNLSKPSPSADGADGFDHLESDELFTFDEDMGRAAKDKTQEKDPEGEYDEDVDVDEKKSKNPLEASSPHAGSLPIEIKWPGRREGRG